MTKKQMRKEKKIRKRWIYETRCCRCGKLNSWIFNPNGNIPTEREIAFHKAFHNEHPFEIKWCEHCKMETRQEWVTIHKVKLTKLK